jgi:Coenzyme F420-dependent N5,N10-methylene tetrahydromethanopterin reductase and related flavin-dependent oxidoreductases
MLTIGYQPWGATLDELVTAARQAEAAGADVIWLPELHRSSTVTAAAVGAATTTATVATGITWAFTRSPMTTALEALDLDELTGGRFRLGLGTGTRRLNEEWHGVPFAHPADRLRETVEGIRMFWRNSATGEPIETTGPLRPMRITGYRRHTDHPVRPIPIYLAGVGPRMVRLAGEIADGWLAHELCTPFYIRERVLPAIHSGLDRAGRSRADIDVTASAVCAVADDPDTASALTAGHVGFYAGVRAYADFFDLHGVRDEHERLAAALRAGVPAHELRASDRMRDALTIAGPPDQVLARLQEYEGIADAVKISPPVHGLAPDQIRRAQAALIALIAEIRSRRGHG